MESIAILLEHKGAEVWTVAPEVVVFDALALMAEKEVGALPVLREEKLVGIVSERDYARKIILQGRSSRETTVAEVMTERVAFVRPEQSVDECMALMTDKRVRHMPVIDSGRLVGIVSLGDLAKAIISEQQFVIEQLENYIHG